MQRLLKEQTDLAVDTVKTRPSSTAVLAVNSGDRYKDGLGSVTRFQLTSPYNFTINAPEPFISGFFTRAALTEVNFPYAIPNINYYSKTIGVSFKKNTGPFVNTELTLDEGWYEFADIAAALQTELQTVDASFTCTYDGYVFNVECEETANFYLYPVYQESFPFQRGLYEMMGWVSNAGGTFGADSLAVSGSPSLLFTRYVDFICDSLTTVQDVRDSSTSLRNKNVLCRLYFDAPSATAVDPTKEFGASPFTIYRDFNSPKQIKWEQSLPIGSLTFQVYNDSGYLLSAQYPFSKLFQEEAPVKIFSTYDSTLPDYQMTLLISEQ